MIKTILLNILQWEILFFWGDFNAHTSTSDLDFVSGDYGKGMEDILPNAYISDSVLLSRNSLKSNIKTDDYGRMLLDLCISSQCRILNGRTLGDTVGNLTSFQYNGCAVVDYCVVDQRLLDSVNFFKIGDFTTFSDHCQLTACFSLNHFENNYKLERKSPKGIKWSKNVADAFQSLILSDSVERSTQNFLSFSWDPNKSDINEATENISSIYQVINKSLNESFSCKVKTKCKKIKKKIKNGLIRTVKACIGTLRALLGVYQSPVINPEFFNLSIFFVNKTKDL